MLIKAKKYDQIAIYIYMSYSNCILPKSWFIQRQYIHICICFTFIPLYPRRSPRPPATRTNAAFLASLTPASSNCMNLSSPWVRTSPDGTYEHIVNDFRLSLFYTLCISKTQTTRIKIMRWMQQIFMTRKDITPK